MARSAVFDIPIVVDAAEPLFSSFGSVGSLTLATFVIMVPSLVFAATWTTSVKRASPPAGKLLLAQLTVPPELGWGVVQLQPAGEVNETNVVPAGMPSFRVALPAASGPSLNTSMV